MHFALSSSLAALMIFTSSVLCNNPTTSTILVGCTTSNGATSKKSVGTTTYTTSYTSKSDSGSQTRNQHGLREVATVLQHSYCAFSEKPFLLLLTFPRHDYHDSINSLNEDAVAGPNDNHYNEDCMYSELCKIIVDN